MHFNGSWRYERFESSWIPVEVDIDLCHVIHLCLETLRLKWRNVLLDVQVLLERSLLAGDAFAQNDDCLRGSGERVGRGFLNHTSQSHSQTVFPADYVLIVVECAKGHYSRFCRSQVKTDLHTYVPIRSVMKIPYCFCKYAQRWYRY